MNISKFLPSKKFLITLGSLVVIGGIASGAYLWHGKKNVSPAMFSPEDAAQVLRQIPNPSNIDTDSDGLKDWEEALWGTDPKNQKTHDGIDDATYIENKKKENIEKYGASASDTNENLTTTDTFARDFYTALAVAAQKGEITEDERQNLTFSTMVYVLGKANFSGSYEEKDAKIATTTKEAIAYLNFFKKINISLQTLMQELSVSVQDINKNQIDSEKLRTLSKKFMTLSQDLMLQSAPQAVITLHVNLANNLNEIGKSLGGIAETEKDPLIGLLASAALKDAMNKLNGTLQEIMASMQE